jgi:hypothetical protein
MNERKREKEWRKTEVGYSKDDRCWKRQNCLSPEVERVRQLTVVPAPDV